MVMTPPRFLAPHSVATAVLPLRTPPHSESTGGRVPAKREQPPSLAVVAATGDRLETLRRLRDTIAEAMCAHDVAARDVAALSGRLSAVLAEIAELAPTETTGTSLDELDSRRRARGAAPARRERPAR